ncbi:MAG: DUF1223 domain-containing protein [Planctomycetota bacterium]
MNRLTTISGAAAAFAGLTSEASACQERTTSPRRFAVVELFTSEGCSSCPPADRLATQIREKAAEEDLPVYLLAFHVDYWDRLGWPDRFSSARATQRQRHYAAVFGQPSVYTPQMVVNGRVGFVGSNAGRAADELTSAFAAEADPELAIEISVDRRHDQKHGTLLDVHVEATGNRSRRAIRSLRVLAALVESGLTTQVERGENAGRELTHDGVVRSFFDAAWTDDPRTLVLPVADDVDPKNAEVIVFLQDSRTLEIVAATRAGLDADDS